MLNDFGDLPREEKRRHEKNEGGNKQGDESSAIYLIRVILLPAEIEQGSFHSIGKNNDQKRYIGIKLGEYTNFRRKENTGIKRDKKVI